MDPAAGFLWQNSTGRVVKAGSAPGQLVVELKGAATVQHQFSVQHLAVVDGTEKPPMAVQVDARRLLLLEKQSALRECGGELQFTEPAGLLGGPELAAFWQAVLVRGRQAF